MSDFEKRVDPNATIQLDKIDVQELVQLEEEAVARAAAAESKPPPAVRKTAPPPLPPVLPEASATTGGSVAPSAAQVAAPARGNTKFYAVAVFLLLASTIALGIAFRSRSHAEETASVAGSAAPSTSAPAAQPSTHTLTLPAVEITGP